MIMSRQKIVLWGHRIYGIARAKALPAPLVGYSRLEVSVEEDVVAVKLKAVFVVDHGFLDTLKTFDEDLVHVPEQFLHLDEEERGKS